jgi:hypothetical protein
MLSRFGDASSMLRIVQTGAATLAIIFFIIRILSAMRDNVTGEKNPNFAEIVGSFVVSLAMVGATPYILQNFLIYLNNGLIVSITDWVAITLEKNRQLSQIVNFNQIEEVWPRIITRIILFFAFILFAYAGAVRFIELVLLIFLGPLLATTYTNRSSIFMNYWTDCVAVVFTQSLHFFLLALMMKLVPEISIGGNDYTNLLLVIAIALVALRGPSILRQYLSSSGLGGTMPQIRTVMMMTNMARRMVK